MIDVGANLGMFAAFAATRADHVRVYAYEPSRVVSEYLLRNVEASRLGNVEVVREAVAGSAGSRPFVEGCNRLLGQLGHPGSEGEPVRCRGLEDVFVAHGLKRCDLLKLDCEGADTRSSSVARPRHSPW